MLETSTALLKITATKTAAAASIHLDTAAVFSSLSPALSGFNWAKVIKISHFSPN
jgi:hypothetical protein